jgi:stearoyl-CoA desaturase (Delta-9 desaturase)
MPTDLLDAPSTIAPPEPPREVSRADRIGRWVTLLIVAAPFAALLFALIALWGRGVHVRDVVLATVLFLLVGHGVTIGFHRLLAHKSFVASPPLKLALVGAGSMAFEGGPIGWVADHRRHHVFSDQEGDPHSPHGTRSPLHGLWHAHIGWLFNHEPTSWPRHAADLLADRTMVVMNALFPLWCVVSLAIPFALGWILGGNMGAALTALLWAGGVRIFFVHHVTWSINSLCHVYGRRPFVTTDRSSNVGALALFTMGESWHNGHHAFPRSARHGLLPHQWDTSARAIRYFEQLGWARDVHWPTAGAIARRASKQGPQPPV